jgi:hypothetical protein
LFVLSFDKDFGILPDLDQLKDFGFDSNDRSETLHIEVNGLLIEEIIDRSIEVIGQYSEWS